MKETMKINNRIVNWHIIIPVLTLLLLVSGCSYPHMYHSPNMMSVPLFNDKGQFSFMPAASFGTVNTSFEMQAAFSLPAHIALGANLMTGGRDNSEEDYDDFSKYNYFEGFGGFYTSFKDVGVFEIYAGYGEGGERHTFAYNDWDWGSGGWVQDGTAEMKFSGFFIQPDIGIRLKTIEAAFALRLSRIDFKEVTFQGQHPEYGRLGELEYLDENRTNWLIEPGFTFRGGHDPVKFQIQAVFSPNLSNPDQQFEHFRFNMGINIRFGGKKKLQAEEALQK
jgi:hypothetical protein